MSAIRWCLAAALACGALFGEELDPKLCTAHPEDREFTGLAERDIDGDTRTAPADIGADEVP